MVLNPVIPAVRNVENCKLAIESPSKVVFLLTGNIRNIEELVHSFKKSGKVVFVHFDLIKGLSYDKTALEFLAERGGIEGVISTHVQLLKIAKDMGLKVVLRVFLVDSTALESGICYAKDLKPDLLEILPGVAPELINEVSKRNPFGTVIAGGFIRKKEQIIAALKAGAKAISTSCVELWNFSL